MRGHGGRLRPRGPPAALRPREGAAAPCVRHNPLLSITEKHGPSDTSSIRIEADLRSGVAETTPVARSRQARARRHRTAVVVLGFGEPSER